LRDIVNFVEWNSGSKYALRGCVNDVKAIYNMLQTHFGFQPPNMKCLIDTNPNGEQPTGANIKKYLTQFVAACQPGDVFVFHFSGHGTQVLLTFFNTSHFDDGVFFNHDLPYPEIVQFCHYPQPNQFRPPLYYDVISQKRCVQLGCVTD
jgi:hypothetical protein